MYAEETNRIEHVMWMSPWQRRQAIRYGDVVIFDPTYNANDQRMPHSHFTIVDNMMKSQEVAQALHLNEQTATFEWMFRCYLEAAPRMKTLFTDQDDAIAAAIVLTNICDMHRLCLWHILMNMTKHLSMVLGVDFVGLRNAIVALASNEYDNSISAWELEWSAMLDIYENLSGEHKPLKYLHSLYKHKKQWARVFQYGVMDLNIRSTQRGESMNAHSKLFCDRKTTLYQVRDLAHREFEVEKRKVQDTQLAYEAYRNVRAAYPQAWYRQIAGLITSAVLKLFDEQMELAGTGSYDLVERPQPDGKRLIEITTTTSGAIRTVTFDDDAVTIIACSCYDFFAMGLPCRHICRVMVVHGQGSAATTIGAACLHKRWSRDIALDQITYITEVRSFDDQRRALETDVAAPATVLDPALAARRRHADMTNLSKQLFALIVDDESACTAYMEAVTKKIEALTIQDSLPPSTSSADGQRPILNPTNVKAPGRPKTKRIKSSVEGQAPTATKRSAETTRQAIQTALGKRGAGDD